MADDSTSLQSLIDELRQLRMDVESQRGHSRELGNVRRALEDIAHKLENQGGSD